MYDVSYVYVIDTYILPANYKSLFYSHFHPSNTFYIDFSTLYFHFPQTPSLLFLIYEIHPGSLYIQRLTVPREANILQIEHKRVRYIVLPFDSHQHRLTKPYLNAGTVSSLLNQ